MGARFLVMTVEVKSKLEVEQAFHAAQVQAEDKNRCGWSGDWNMAEGLEWGLEHPVASAHIAESYLRSKCEKWKAAVAVPYRNGERIAWMVGACCATSGGR